MSENCIDRHLATQGDQTAIIWEPDSPTEASKHITYNELHTQVSKMANVYKSLGVTKGDRVILYMPMIPEAAFAMLACTRIGAIHSVVFGGFSSDALAARIKGSEAKLVVTADQAPRAGKATPLKTNADAAMGISGDVNMLVVERTGADVGMKAGRDYSYNAMMAEASANCPAEQMNA